MGIKQYNKLVNGFYILYAVMWLLKCLKRIWLKFNVLNLHCYVITQNEFKSSKNKKRGQTAFMCCNKKTRYCDVKIK